MDTNQFGCGGNLLNKPQFTYCVQKSNHAYCNSPIICVCGLSFNNLSRENCTYNCFFQGEVNEGGLLVRILISWSEVRVVTNNVSCLGGPVLYYTEHFLPQITAGGYLVYLLEWSFDIRRITDCFKTDKPKCKPYVWL